MNPLSPSSSQLEALLSAPCSECKAGSSATVWCGCGAGICHTCLSRHGRKCKTRTRTPLELSQWSCACLLRGADMFARCCGVAICEPCTNKHLDHPELQIREDNVFSWRYEKVDQDSVAAMLNFFDQALSQKQEEVESLREAIGAVEAAKEDADEKINSLKDSLSGMHSEMLKSDEAITSLSAQVAGLSKKNEESQQYIGELLRKLARYENKHSDGS